MGASTTDLLKLGKLPFSKTFLAVGSWIIYINYMFLFVRVILGSPLYHELKHRVGLEAFVNAPKCILTLSLVMEFSFLLYRVFAWSWYYQPISLLLLKNLASIYFEIKEFIQIEPPLVHLAAGDRFRFDNADGGWGDCTVVFSNGGVELISEYFNNGFPKWVGRWATMPGMRPLLLQQKSVPIIWDFNPEDVDQRFYQARFIDSDTIQVQHWDGQVFYFIRRNTDTSNLGFAASCQDEVDSQLTEEGEG
eukprot:gnl/MRDRNA2_/MRDRNA2_79681_c0_seq1.p1 gnl/MRDRNA2_/MRDRNA2_79681_c0~~gnl/MRDRNA2_/MRDRNA2_79681_c0_seq1.p1  ORF type:complete len:263 (-),score=23.20 gnl/MRDRNA2_/MRDRNA2_79681_c0_seq1:42-788(-)